MKRDPLPAKVLATRLIPNVSADLAQQLNLRPDQNPWLYLQQTVMMLLIQHLMRLQRKQIVKLYTQKASTVELPMQIRHLPVKLSVFLQHLIRQKQRPDWKQQLI